MKLSVTVTFLPQDKYDLDRMAERLKISEQTLIRIAVKQYITDVKEGVVNPLGRI